MELDRLYAVSDLHIGGAAGQRAFREQRALAWLIGEAAVGAPQSRVGLLLNGDVFDFLADPTNADEFVPAAGLRIREYAADPDLRPIFTALQAYVASDDRYLIVQIGNHDIELALPNVQGALRDIIDPTGAARDRILFESDRRGWACRVAGKMVLAVHGNESDPWNAVDHDKLAAAARAQAAGSAINAPITNAGTILVLEVMNKIKDKFPIVDLFKPEGPPLLAILAWLDPPRGWRGLGRATARLLRRGGLAGARELLGSDGEVTELPASGPGRELVDFVDSLQLAPPDSRAIMKRAEENLRAGKSPRDLPDDDGYLGAILDKVATWRPRFAAQLDGLKRPPATVLQDALRGWLARDRSFELDALGEIDERIVEAGRIGFDVLIAGHTHLAREKRLGALTYLNTGTWMRLLKLQDSRYLHDPAAFAQFLVAIDAGTLGALDALDQLDQRLRPVAIVDGGQARLESVAETATGFELRPARQRLR